MVDKISAFKGNLHLSSTRAHEDKFAYFPNFKIILEDANDNGVREKVEIVRVHLKNLSA